MVIQAKQFISVKLKLSTGTFKEFITYTSDSKCPKNIQAWTITATVFIDVFYFHCQPMLTYNVAGSLYNTSSSWSSTFFRLDGTKELYSLLTQF